MAELRVLHEEVAARAREIADAHGGWPCRKGCDRCCRSLADAPRLTRPEWELLQDGLARLPAGVRHEIELRLTTLNGSVCPFLDGEAGACLVYEHRPIACRTYGFYVERDRGLYCREIEAMVERGECGGVVWGNAESVERRLRALGESIDVRTWFSAEGFEVREVASPGSGALVPDQRFAADEMDR
jgi:Fe-S-cluster containining protein